MQSFDTNLIKREGEIVRLKKELSKLKQRIQRVKEKYILQHVTEQEYCMLIMPLVEEQTNIEIRLKVLSMNAYGHSDSILVTEKERYEYIHNNFKKIWINMPAKKNTKDNFFLRFTYNISSQLISECVKISLRTHLYYVRKYKNGGLAYAKANLSFFRRVWH